MEPTQRGREPQQHGGNPWIQPYLKVMHPPDFTLASQLILLGQGQLERGFPHM